METEEGIRDKTATVQATNGKAALEAHGEPPGRKTGSRDMSSGDTSETGLGIDNSSSVSYFRSPDRPDEPITECALYWKMLHDIDRLNRQNDVLSAEAAALRRVTEIAKLREQEPRVAKLTMTIPEVAAYTSLSKTKVRSLVHRRVLKVIVGDESLGESRKTKHLILKRDVDEYMQKRAHRLPPY